MSIQGTPTAGIRWIVDSTGAIVGYRNPVSDQDAASSPVATYTAAQLSAMATAGTLTPLATYVPSDASPPYQLWARDASTLGSPLGCDIVNVQFGTEDGATLEVLP